jgi:raffinose/stachyose/melibiose transport system substrate-binding protein
MKSERCRGGTRAPAVLRVCLRSIGAAALLAAAALAGTTTAAVAEANTLTVWDFKSEEPLMKPYFTHVISEFEKRHPGVTVREVAQPEGNYESILGAAAGAGQGPDVALMHGGENARRFRDAMVPLGAEMADATAHLNGLDSFRNTDGSLIGVPISVQGFIIYYNKDVYQLAGLDPDKAPQTWDELAANCKAIAAHTKANCYGLGNKNGVGVTSTLAALATGTWSPEVRAQFMSRKLDWTSAPVRAVFATMESMVADKWIEPGANSYSPYTDMPRIFAAGRVAHVAGLISDAPNAWKNLEQLIGTGHVGVAMPVAIGHSPKDQPNRLAVSGGIGFGVTRWSANRDLALDYVRIAVEPASQMVFMESAGGMPTNPAVDINRMSSPAAKAIIAFLACCSLPNQVSDSFLPEERQELVRSGQLLLNGQITVDEILTQLDRARKAAAVHVN